MFINFSLIITCSIYSLVYLPFFILLLHVSHTCMSVYVTYFMYLQIVRVCVYVHFINTYSLWTHSVFLYILDACFRYSQMVMKKHYLLLSNLFLSCKIFHFALRHFFVLSCNCNVILFLISEMKIQWTLDGSMYFFHWSWIGQLIIRWLCWLY